jgi:hypothetical protein
MIRAASVETPSTSTDDTGDKMRPMHGLNELCQQGRMTWTEEEHGWVAAPEDIVNALSNEGFQECKHETTTSRRDLRPAGGVWQGVNTRTGSVASAVWVGHPPHARAIVFITIDGESVMNCGTLRARPDPYTADGGEG